MFTEAWFGAVRQIVLGRRARDAPELTELLARRHSCRRGLVQSIWLFGQEKLVASFQVDWSER
jgi:hypothetical protein